MSGQTTINGKTISVIPQWDGINISRSNDMVRSATLRYNIIGTTEPEEADRALSQCCNPIILGNLYRSTSSIERTARKLYEGIVEYEYKNTDEFTFSFDTSGGTQHLTQSFQTLGRYAPLGMFPPNHWGAIGVNDRDIAGCDVITPALSFSMTRTKTGVLNLEFIKFLAGMTGRINNTAFLSFFPGEVLFEGASGSQRYTSEDNPSFDVTYKFRISPSIVDLSVGNSQHEFAVPNVITTNLSAMTIRSTETHKGSIMQVGTSLRATNLCRGMSRRCSVRFVKAAKLPSPKIRSAGQSAQAPPTAAATAASRGTPAFISVPTKQVRPFGLLESGLVPSGGGSPDVLPTLTHCRIQE